MDAYCFKCRSKREIKEPQQVTLKNTGKAPAYAILDDLLSDLKLV